MPLIAKLHLCFFFSKPVASLLAHLGSRNIHNSTTCDLLFGPPPTREPKVYRALMSLEVESYPCVLWVFGQNPRPAHSSVAIK